MNIADYIRNKNKQNQNMKVDTQIDVNQAINKYGAMSEEELMRELFRVGSVSSGNVSSAELDGFYEQVKNFLTPEQSEKMRNLIIQFKKTVMRQLYE